MPSPSETALLIALMLKNSGRRRARLTSRTVKKLSGRDYLKASFVRHLQEELDNLGFVLPELAQGGFGLLPVGALEGAPRITAAIHMDEYLTQMKQGEVIDFDEICALLALDEDGGGDVDADE